MFFDRGDPGNSSVVGRLLPRESAAFFRAKVYGETFAVPYPPYTPRWCQPLTAPAARPEPSLRWTITKKIITGTVTSVELAMTGPQDVEFSPKNW